MAIHVHGYLRLKIPTKEVKELIERFGKDEVWSLLQCTRSTERAREMTFEVPLEGLEGLFLEFFKLLLKQTKD